MGIQLAHSNPVHETAGGADTPRRPDRPTTSEELSELLQAILDQICELVDSDACAVLLLAGQTLELAAAQGIQQYAEFYQPGLNAPVASDILQLIREGAPLIVDDAALSGPFASLARSNDLHACILAPMLYRGRPVGCLLVFKHTAGVYSGQAAKSVMAAANQMATTIENARLYAETRRRALQLEAASQVSRRVTSILETDQLLAQIVGLIREMLGYDHANLFLVDGRSNEIVLRESSGNAEESLQRLGLRLKIGKQGITGWVAASGQPLLCNDVSQEHRYHPHELLPQTKSELAVPLRVGDVVVGVLDVQSDYLDAFHEDDITALQVLADQAAIAIENAHLFQETRRQVEAMRVLHDIALDITAQVSTDEMLLVILRQAEHLLAAQGSSLGLLDADAGNVRLIAIHNLPAEFKDAVLPLGQGAAGWVVANAQPVIVNDYGAWPHRSLAFADSPFDAIVSVPLRWNDQVIGALSVTDRGDARPFSNDDVNLLGLLADLASIALKNAELFSELKQAGDQLERMVEKRTQQLSQAQAEVARKAAELQGLLAITVRVQEEERSRIARDLHDGSNQLIAGTLYELQAAQESVAGGRTQMALEKLAVAKGLLRRIESENRQIIVGLRPPILDAHGLVPALRWQATNFQEHSQVVCSLQVNGTPLRLPSDTEVAVFRIVQEALNNVSAHSHARSARIEVGFVPGLLTVRVTDDGVGFNRELAGHQSSGRMGLIGIHERAQSIGGRLAILSVPNQGTQLILEVPLADSRLAAAGPAAPASQP